MLVVCSIGSAWAKGEKFSVWTTAGDLNSAQQSRTDGKTGDFFTIDYGGDNKPNKKFACKYAGVSYSVAFKMASSSSIEFTSAAVSTVTIVQSIADTKTASNTLKFDGVVKQLTDGVEISDNDNEKVRVYTLTDIAAGTHKIARGSGEIGIAFVCVEYTGAAMTQLDAPTISYDAANGSVTITDPNTSSEGIYYTTDGTAPSTTNGTKYESPFPVADGSTVKAIAIGDGTSTITSAVAERLVILTGITISQPVIASYNGTVAITCTSPNATIEYSTDGTNYVTYTRAFTLTEDATVYARASREGCTTSTVATETVTAVAANVKSRTIYFCGEEGNYNEKFSSSPNTVTGVGGFAGYSLQISGNTAKAWSAGESITINGKEYKTLKVSNGAQNTLTLPDGVKATRLTLYSYVNFASTSAARTPLGWKEVNGTEYSQAATNAPMGAFSDLSDISANPDVRIFPLDDVTGSITFTNSGEQLCFVLALDVIESETVTVGADGYASYCGKNNIDLSSTGIEAYVAESVSGTTINMRKIDVVPANMGVILKSVSGIAVSETITGQATAPAVGTNLLEGILVDTEVPAANNYIFGKGDSGIGFYPLTASHTLAGGKAYLHYEAVADGAKGLTMSFGETTGINEVNASDAKKADNVYYNLNGMRVAAPQKGVYIINGKKVVLK